jgi:hypothetical protein
MNLKKMSAIFLFAAFTFISCKKENVAPAPVPVHPAIEGSWLGKYGSGNNTPNSFYSFNILKGGLLEIKAQDNTVNGTGTWTLADGVFKAVYKYNASLAKYNVAGKYDEKAGTINGSWGAGEVNADDGEFFLNKQ